MEPVNNAHHSLKQDFKMGGRVIQNVVHYKKYCMMGLVKDAPHTQEQVKMGVNVKQIYVMKEKN